MHNKLRWGVLSTANIGLKKVIPAMQKGEYTTVAAIASRDLTKAREAATALGIPTAYGSYEELLADPNIDAIYNPLPNHLHVPWTIKAAEAGKHVLCEKPLSLTVAEAKTLLAVRARTGVKIGEAFMVDCHPQWLRLRELLDEGRIGELRSIAGFFSYFNIDPANIRNRVECGGGALMDIGCYLIHASRYAFAQEPTRVVACIDRDPADAHRPAHLGDSRLSRRPVHLHLQHAVGSLPAHPISSAPAGASRSKSPSTRLPTAPPAFSSTMAGDLFGSGIATETFPVCDQYTLQGDAFSKAVLEDTEVPVPIEEAIKNMAAIEAIFNSAKTGQWESPRQ